MNIKSQINIVAAFSLVCLSGMATADDKKVNQKPSDWTPYSFGSSLNSTTLDSANASNSKVIPLYSDRFSSDFLDSDNSDALSIGIEDASDGLWKFSLDVNQSQEDLFSEEQYRLNTSYSPDGNNSTFYINYGSRRVPVSIKVDEFLDYNQAGRSGSDLSLGFDQKINDSWAVSISYTKSELEQAHSENSLFGFEQSLATNQQYWFDLNRDGLPEAVNLFSELGASSNFDKAFEGIEIRLTRQVNENLSIGGALSKVQSDFDWQPYQFDDLGDSASSLGEVGFSVFSQLDFSTQWSLGAQLSNKTYEQKPAQVVSLVSDSNGSLNFDSTTLDIGVKYQGRWDDVGLVIRIDLVNLLGGDSELNKLHDYNDTGLAPYTFETPKYIKLSGSINF